MADLAILTDDAGAMHARNFAAVEYADAKGESRAAYRITRQVASQSIRE